MGRLVSQETHAVVGSPEGTSAYPLQRSFIQRGLWVGLLAGGVFLDLLPALAFFVLFAATGMLWRRDEPPILPFIIAFQWAFVVSPYFYRTAFGGVPGFSVVGKLDEAILLSLLGFLALAIGMRAAFKWLDYHAVSVKRSLEGSTPPYNVRSLFWIVVTVYTINWFIQIFPQGLYFHAAEIINTALEFRKVLLTLLFFVIVQQKKGYLYGGVALLFVLIPVFAETHAKFIDIFLCVLIPVLWEWRPWSKVGSVRRRTWRITWVFGGLAVALFAMAIIWLGAVRPVWRPMLQSGGGGASPAEKAYTFISIAMEEVPRMDWQKGFEVLMARMSGVVFFAFVLERVPEIVPHEYGLLSLIAVEHSVKPRILFPEKRQLYSDSWMIRAYAGLEVAGEEARTSIGLGYMPELYIDWGIEGFYFALFVYGLALGSMYMGIFRVCRLHYFASASVGVMFWLGFTNFDGGLAKQLGSVAIWFVVLCVLLRTVAPSLHRMCLKKGKDQGRRVEVASKEELGLVGGLERS